MKKFFLLALIASTPALAAENSNSVDEHYTCAVDQKLNAISVSLGGKHFSEETETAKIKWDGSRFTVYGMEGGDYVSVPLVLATERDLESISAKLGVEITPKDRENFKNGTSMVSVKDNAFHNFANEPSGIIFSVVNQNRGEELFQFFTQCTLDTAK